MDLRNTFFSELKNLMIKDEDVYLLYIDLGNFFVEGIAKKFPDRCINTGCIEQSAIDIAVGLALGGKKPYVYSVINFLLFRAYEMVRNDIAYENTNVKLIGVRGKESYKFLGISHNISWDEDVHVLETLPNIEICIPENKTELKKLMIDTYKKKCPAYFRI